jgi:hypothetical protein
VPDDEQQKVDLYKLMVEMADRVSARRGAANGFFLTLHTALAAVIAALPLPETGFRPVVLGVTGLLLAFAWWVLLRRYRVLNAAKYDVIQEMEECLPSQPYRREWALLTTRPKWSELKGKEKWGWRPGYRGLTAAEQFVPLAFALLYVVALVSEVGRELPR